MKVTSFIILLRLRKIHFFHQTEVKELIGDYKERVRFLDYNVEKNILQKDYEGNYSFTINGKSYIERCLKMIEQFK